MHIIHDNVAQLLQEEILQRNSTKIINDNSSTQMDIESDHVDLNNSTTITANKCSFYNKEAIKQLVQKYVTTNSKLEEAGAKLERLQK